MFKKELARRTEAKKPQIISEVPPPKTVYSGKYALSGIMFCGTCNSLYRRCTWKRNGKTRIVWRCQNRLKNGTKFCLDSPTIEESDLHKALAAAINGMLYQKEFLLKPFEETDISVRCQTLAGQQKRSDDVIVNLIAQYAENQNWDEDTEPFRTLIAKRQVFPPNISP